MTALSLPAHADAVLDREIARLMDLPENEIDVGIAALTLAKEIYPDTDVAAYSRKIDALADQVRRLANGSLDPEIRIRVINTVLYRREGFHYDRDPFSRSRQEYYFLTGVLDSKKGICYTLPLLYVAVAQRVGYPMYPVAAPDHMFVRYADPAFKAQNIEATSGGKYFEDSWYIQDFSISQSGLKSGAYLRTMTYREFMGQLLAANAFIWARKGNSGKAVSYLEKAVRLYPKCTDCYVNLGSIYAGMSRITQGEKSHQFEEKSRQYAMKAKQLGDVNPAMIKLGRELRGK